MTQLCFKYAVLKWNMIYRLEMRKSHEDLRIRFNLQISSNSLWADGSPYWFSVCRRRGAQSEHPMRARPQLWQKSWMAQFPPLRFALHFPREWRLYSSRGCMSTCHSFPVSITARLRLPYGILWRRIGWAYLERFRGTNREEGSSEFLNNNYITTFLNNKYIFVQLIQRKLYYQHHCRLFSLQTCDVF